MKYENFYYLDESINDKNLFKAIFLAGGPGSGKSFIGKLAFHGDPVVFINPDKFTEYLFNKEKLSLVFDKMNKEQHQKQMSLRGRAVDLTKKQFELIVNGMLPMVIDGTGRDYDKIKTQYDFLKEIGYDVGMIFINTSKEVALQRNNERDRKVPDEFLVSAWESVQDNLGKFQKLFGDDKFFVIDNNEKLTTDEINELRLKLTRLSRKFLNEPLENVIGNDRIDKLKKSGAQYLDQIRSMNDDEI
jgi:predicted kinase